VSSASARPVEDRRAAGFAAEVRAFDPLRHRLET
jgi:hypothetical protein